MLHLDLKTTMANNDLHKVNRICELGGIDVRYPMLDQHVRQHSAERAGYYGVMIWVLTMLELWLQAHGHAKPDSCRCRSWICSLSSRHDEFLYQGAVNGPVAAHTHGPIALFFDEPARDPAHSGPVGPALEQISHRIRQRD